MKCRYSILLFFALLFVADQVFAQGYYNIRRARNLVVTGGTGLAFYFGDLADPGDISNITPNFTVGARYNVTNRIAVGTDLTWFMLRGADSKSETKQIRNLSFRSHNFELNLIGQVTLFEEGERFYLRPLVNPYIYAGIGVVQFNPTAELDGERYYLPDFKTEQVNYSTIALCIPAGIGLKFRLNPFFNISVDGGFRWVQSDYLDDVSSGIYPEHASFEDPIARRLSDRSGETGLNPSLSEKGSMVRGNPDKNDAYFIFNAKLEYYIGTGAIFGSQNRYKGKMRRKKYRGGKRR
ncbi:MAG TPA: hypothetical protein DDY13_02225 [Cytophagales bacterium]|jgi:hypothetical protein|nr:hypothetical protein [Cytophagales bacterium]